MQQLLVTTGGVDGTPRQRYRSRLPHPLAPRCRPPWHHLALPSHLGVMERDENRAMPSAGRERTSRGAQHEAQQERMQPKGSEVCHRQLRSSGTAPAAAKPRSCPTEMSIKFSAFETAVHVAHGEATDFRKTPIRKLNLHDFFCHIFFFFPITNKAD